MTFMLPIMLKAFENVTSTEYIAGFNKPCDFRDMLDLFNTLPPYFNSIGSLYPNQTELISYYSMQLASTFLVNKKSLTIECLYNMLSLQSRLGSFAINILEHPEKNEKLVGTFGRFMKEPAKPLRDSPMLKILEHVNKYEKNDDKDKILNLFTIFNIIFICVSVIGILTNFILFSILKCSSSKTNRKEESEETPLDNQYLLFAKRNQSCIYLCLITICHTIYLFVNFIIMSQTKLAAFALGNLNTSQFACKIAFVLFPPTTAYNIVHQYAIILLVFALYKHGKKIRRIKYIQVDQSEFFGYTEDIYEIDDNDSIKAADASLSNKNKTKASENNATENYSCLNENKRNSLKCFLIFLLILIYNSQNFILYSLNEVSIINKYQNLSAKFCAFSSDYSKYYILINQEIIPILNLTLFVIFPIIYGIHQLWVDVCLLIILKREQRKRYEFLNEYHIEWVLYIFFIIFFISQVPLCIHQIIDLVFQNFKFPFVFPMFISLIFSTKVTLVLVEMSLLCFAYSSSFFVFWIFDFGFRNIIKFYFYKYILCRTLNL
jgi:hypothetical protein